MTSLELFRGASLGTSESFAVNKDRRCSHYFSLFLNVLWERMQNFDFSGFCLGTRNDEHLTENRVLFMNMNEEADIFPEQVN